jgi:hypothetical protein
MTYQEKKLQQRQNTISTLRVTFCIALILETYCVTSHMLLSYTGHITILFQKIYFSVSQNCIK